MKPWHAYTTAALLALGGLFFSAQAESFREDRLGSGWTLSDCQIGSLGSILEFQPKGIDTSNCASLENSENFSRTASNASFFGAAGAVGFGIYLSREAKRNNKREN